MASFDIDDATDEEITFFKLVENGYYLARQGRYNRAVSVLRQANGFWSEVRD